MKISGFGGLGVACWPLVPKFAGSNPAEAVGFLRVKKSSARLDLRHVKDPYMTWKPSFRQNYRTTFSPTVPTSAAHVVADVEAPGGEKWERLKSGGKQWQATPKNFPRMQRTRAIPVA